MTRCCSCGDEITEGSRVWQGAHEDETACSMICRYRNAVESVDGYSMSKEAAEVAALTRVEAARMALLHDPEIFGEDVFSVTVKAEMKDGRESVTARMIVIGASESYVRFEIVSAEDDEYDGTETLIPWKDVIDMVPRP